MKQLSYLSLLFSFLILSYFGGKEGQNVKNERSRI